MSVKDNITRKLSQTFNDKQDLNKQALRLNKSLKEVQKALGNSKPKKD